MSSGPEAGRGHPPRKGPPPRADLVLDARGIWLSDGVEVTHPGILQALHGGLRREPSGEFSVQVGWQKALVEVEEAPFFVRSIRFPDDGPPRITLLDGTEQDLDVHTLRLGGEEGDVLTCSVRGDRARFLPAAMHQCGERIVEREGDLFIRVGSREVPLRPDTGKAKTRSTKTPGGNR